MDLALKIVTNLMQANASPDAYQAVIGKAIEATGSEMIVGSVKETIKNFFKVAAAKGVLQSGASQMLINFVTLKAQAAAACLAVAIANNNQFAGILEQLWSMVGQQDPNQLIVGALTIGEYGKVKDLSGEGRILPMVQQLFNHQQEDVKTAASICMGNVTIGNPDFFLSKVFDLIRSSQVQQKYLFLNTIREIIIADSRCVADYMMDIQDMLVALSSSDSAQIRNIVAEILGRLLADFPEDFMDTVTDGLRSNDNVTKATRARAVKYAGSKLTHGTTVEMLTIDLVGL